MQGHLRMFVVPLLGGRRWRHVCEIGASLGEGTDMLLSVPGVRVTVVDPGLDCDLKEKYAGSPTPPSKKEPVSRCCPMTLFTPVRVSRSA
jgi:hypothetical protein